jgi:hypothetical protein
MLLVGTTVRIYGNVVGTLLQLLVFRSEIETFQKLTVSRDEHKNEP